MTHSLFVRIRNQEGQYLGGDVDHLAFYDDVNRAIVFDCRRDRIDEQLTLLRWTKGIELRPEPVDPKETHESCDVCGCLALSFRMYFDGQKYLCSQCRASESSRRPAAAP